MPEMEYSIFFMLHRESALILIS